MSIIKSKAYCLIYSRLICRKDFKKQAHSIVFESLQTKKKILKKELSISLFSIQFLTWSHKSGEGGGQLYVNSILYIHHEIFGIFKAFSFRCICNGNVESFFGKTGRLYHAIYWRFTDSRQPCKRHHTIALNY